MIEETAYAPVVSPVGSIDPHALGKRGERRACDNLRERGWDILQTNWDSGFGEVDIIARAPELPYETVVFVEVKTRRTLGDDDLMPEEAVDFDKRGRYRNAAKSYLQLHEWVANVRFDVIALTVFPDGHAHLHQDYAAFGMDN